MLTCNTNKAFNCNRPTLSSAEAFLCRREAGEKEKESARGMMGRGKKEERPFPTFSLFPRPSRAFYFFHYCYFYWRTQREPLRRGEDEALPVY